MSGSVSILHLIVRLVSVLSWDYGEELTFIMGAPRNWIQIQVRFTARRFTIELSSYLDVMRSQSYSDYSDSLITY